MCTVLICSPPKRLKNRLKASLRGRGQHNIKPQLVGKTTLVAYGVQFKYLSAEHCYWSPEPFYLPVSTTAKVKMRGVVLEELELRLPFLRTAAIVLVSVRNRLSTDGAFNNESTLEWTSANGHEEDFIPFMDFSADNGRVSSFDDAQAYWFNPDVIPMMTAQGAVPSGSKRTHSTAQDEPDVKRPRCDIVNEALNAALSSEDQTSEGIASGGIVWSAEDLIGRAMCIETIGYDAGIESICYDAGNEGISDQEVTFSLKPTSVIDTRDSAHELFSARLPFADINAEQQLGEKWMEDTFPVGNVCIMPSLQVHPVSSSLTTAQTSLGHHDPRPSLDPLLAGEWPYAPSASLSEPSSDEPKPSRPTSESSSQITSSVSTREGLNLKPLIYAQLQEVKSLLGLSDGAQLEGNSLAYSAARRLLLSPEAAKTILNIHRGRIRAGRNTNMANAPYLSSSWLLERLMFHEKVPAYLIELQTAFECFGYDNVKISDLSRRALDLAYSLKIMHRAHASDARHSSTQNASKYPVWAAEIVRDAFFSGRPLRPDFKTYLRNKLRIQNVGSLHLDGLRGQVPTEKGSMKSLKASLSMIKRVTNPRALTRHPLDFSAFFDDVFHIVTTDQSVRRTDERGAASTNTQQPNVTKSKDVNAEFDKVMAVVTKYERLFEVDIAAEVGAMLKEAPDRNGLELFESAVEEGYVPADLLRLENDTAQKRYTLKAHCLLGSITSLYRRLFEGANETSSLEPHGSQTTSDSEGRSLARDGSVELDVVRKYLLQPLVTPSKGELTPRDFDPLSASFSALALWKEKLKPSSEILSIPKDLDPLISSSAPYGTPRWVLAQLMQGWRPREHQEHRNELQFAFGLLGYQPVDIKQLLARAFVLAAAIITERKIPFEDAINKMKLSKISQVYVLAADIVHAAFFQTWPQRRDLANYFGKQLKYEVLPQHEECLREVVAKREEWHPQKAVRTQKGDKEVVRDWSNILIAKKLYMEEMEDDHPLSFNRFLKDVEVITKGDSPALPEIVSKYKLLFDRDIVEDLKTIRTQSPQICYNKSLVKGIEEGYVPYGYAVLLTLTRSKGLMVGNNSLCLLGAYVDYFMSLVGPADTAVSQHLTVTASLSSDDAVDQTYPLSRPDQKEQRAQLKAILSRAPPQKLLSARIAVNELSTLHPVAQFLLARS
eukprot:Blabericola_migrator_1__6872@NODE_347_length_9536_cov_48_697223_g279_i0_p1_GENE_NODE_347_length_9536_cov_48_697223_g279_i0NODE_347_length_9536_cov_48_697223_g279_i0_p1_ORF_typecomplete_len1172_score200_88Filament_head/PF04732_14/2_1e02Filament_head/PF04732_14/7_1_NODE_347_length_9536_cov_48_697223_g279_i0493564